MPQSFICLDVPVLLHGAGEDVLVNGGVRGLGGNESQADTGLPWREGWGWVSRTIILAFFLLYLFSEFHFVFAGCYISSKNQKLLAVDDDSSKMKVNHAGSVVKRESIYKS